MKRMLSVLFLAGSLVAQQVNAGMIATDKAAPAGEREKVKALLERPEVAKQLEKFGLSANDAEARVDAMTDQEVAQLAGKIDALPAGGVLSNDQLLIVLLLVVIIAILL
jgi:hypothetical protein